MRGEGRVKKTYTSFFRYNVLYPIPVWGRAKLFGPEFRELWPGPGIGHK